MTATPKGGKPAQRAKKTGGETPSKAKRPPAKKPAAKSKKPATRGKSSSTSSTTTPTRRRQLSVKKAVEADIDQMAKRDPSVATSARAATALAMAKAIDNPKASPTSKSMCARVLNDTLDRMLELLPPVKENDDLDKLRSKRAARRASAAS